MEENKELSKGMSAEELGKVLENVSQGLAYYQSLGELKDGEKSLILRHYVGKAVDSEENEVELSINPTTAEPIVRIGKKFFTLSWYNIIAMAEYKIANQEIINGTKEFETDDGRGTPNPLPEGNGEGA